MNKRILMILVVSLIFLIGIGAANALDLNSTEEVEVLKLDDSVFANSSGEVLASESDNVSLVALANSSDDTLELDNGSCDAVGVCNDSEDVC